MNMNNLNLNLNPQQKLQHCFDIIKSKIDLQNFQPKIALILGTGLGDLADEIDIKFTLNYSEIAGHPISTAPSHRGRYVFGYIENVPIVIMQGRIHFYEGYAMSDVVLPTRLMYLMGAKTLFITNSVGACNLNFAVGDFMLIKDQISLLVPSPLIGKNFDNLGERFPTMNQIYSPKLCEIVLNTAKDLNIKLQQGVYVQTQGANFESPTEMQMLKILGADVVGMSTAVEAIAANHAKMEIVGLSFIANVSGDDSTYEKLIEITNGRYPYFKNLVKTAIVNIYKNK